MIIIIYLILSFLFDSITTNYLNFELTDLSCLKTIYTIISLVVIYPYFRNKNKYLLAIIITSVIFDIRYTNTFILNTVIFILIYIINITLDNHLPNNIMTINIKSYLSIIAYHVLTYLILLLSNYNHYELHLLGSIIIRNLPMTIIYTTISYLILKKIAPKPIK